MASLLIFGSIGAKRYIDIYILYFVVYSNRGRGNCGKMNISLFCNTFSLLEFLKKGGQAA